MPETRTPWLSGRNVLMQRRELYMQRDREKARADSLQGFK